MPIYEYKCTECDYRLEKLQKMSDDPIKDCPECEQSALIKLVSASSFKLKGTGWYETDFKGKKKTEPASSKESTTDKKTSSQSSGDNAKAKTTAN